MKTMITTIALLLVTLASYAQSATHTLRVEVSNASTDKGAMVYALSTKADFGSPQPFKSAKVTIEDGKAIAMFENVPTGEYAIIALHDLNGNGKMDFENTGRPMEDYGTSSGTITYGPPNWEESKFELKKDHTVKIRL
ncbi:MAG: DUF2141 domain-containing protein [Nonlabens sp.]